MFTLGMLSSSPTANDAGASSPSESQPNPALLPGAYSENEEEKSEKDSDSDSSSINSDSSSGSTAWSVREFTAAEDEIAFFETVLRSLEPETDSTTEPGETPTAIAKHYSPRTLEAMLSLGIAYHKAGDDAKADEFLSPVHRVMAQIWGWDNPLTQACVRTNVSVLSSLGRHAEASTMYETAILGTRRALGREYPWTLELLNNFACLCAINNDAEKAQALFEEAYDGKRHVFGPHHKTTLDTLCNLLRIVPEDRRASLEKVLLRAINLLRKSYGESHIVVQRAMRHGVALYTRLGEVEEARRLSETCGIEAPIDADCGGWHIDELIPPISREGRVARDDEEAAIETLTEIIAGWGPMWGTNMLLLLNWSRRFVRKWTGMDIATLTDQLGFAQLGWNKYTDPWVEAAEPATLLDLACGAGHEAAVKALLGRWKKPRDGSPELKVDMQRAFRKGVNSGSKGVVELLLKQDVKVDACDERGRSALHDAAEKGYESVVALLLEHNVDNTRIDLDGDSPMDLAVRGQHEAIVRLFMDHNGAILVSSGIKARDSKRRRRMYTCEEEEDTGFEATIVHFYVDRGEVKDSDESRPPGKPTVWEEHRVQVEQVEDLVLDRNSLFSEAMRSRTGQENYPGSDFVWIHLPANNMDWVEALMDTIESQWESEEPFPDALQNELWKHQMHHPNYLSVHSRFMKPLCRAVPGADLNRRGNLVAYMPYVHWESDKKRIEMNDMIKLLVAEQGLDWTRLRRQVKDQFERGKKNGDSGKTESPDESLLKANLFPVPPRSPVHIRRTLDQFQYYMTENTDDRDTDQVITRYFQRNNPAEEAPIMMVDQLWLWVLGGKVLITSFPQRWASNDPVKGEQVNVGDITTEPVDMRGMAQSIIQEFGPFPSHSLDTTNIVDGIMSWLKQKNRSPITSVFDLSELVMARCLGLNFDPVEWEHERYPYLELYDYSVNYVANEEIKCFNDFARSEKFSRRQREAEKARREHEAERKKRRETKNEIQLEKKVAKREKEEEKREKARRKLQEKERGKQKEIADTNENVEEAKTAEEAEKRRRAERKKKKLAKKAEKEAKRSAFDKLTDMVQDDFITVNGWKQPPKDAKKKPEELFDISREIELLREVKDIQEELNILDNLFSQQKLVLGPFMQLVREARAISASERLDGEVGNNIYTANLTLGDAIQRHIDFVREIEGRTARPYRHLEDLLDLKQKQANVFEARTTRTSGNTITVFTIVTIIFLPASFMAAFLALPIQEYPSATPVSSPGNETGTDGGGDDKMELRFAVTYTVIVTAAMAAPFIIFALYVNPILKVANRIRTPLLRVWRAIPRVWTYGVAFSMVILRALWITLRLIRRFLWVIWVGAVVLWAILKALDWRAPFREVRKIRKSKKDALREGREWKKRHYIVQTLLGVWQGALWAMLAEDKDKVPDVEEQRSGTIEDMEHSDNQDGDGREENGGKSDTGAENTKDSDVGASSPARRTEGEAGGKAPSVSSSVERL